MKVELKSESVNKVLFCFPIKAKAKEDFSIHEQNGDFHWLSTVNIDVLRTGCRNFLSVKDLTQIRVNYTGIAKRTSYEE